MSGDTAVIVHGISSPARDVAWATLPLKVVNKGLYVPQTAVLSRVHVTEVPGKTPLLAFVTVQLD